MAAGSKSVQVGASASPVTDDAGAETGRIDSGPGTGTRTRPKPPSDQRDDIAELDAMDDDLFDESDSSDDDEPLSPGAPPRLVSWWVRSDWGLYLTTVLFTVFATVQAMDLWSANLRAPFGYLNDATAVLAHFRTVMQTGWYENQSQLGAPLGQTYHDFPQADNLHMMAAWVLGHVTDNPALAVNIYYLLGFVLAALGAVWFLRQVGVSKTMTLALAVLFAIAPFHWEKGVNHLFLAAYFPVPLAAGVILWAIRGERLWGFRRTGQPGWRRWTGWVTGRGAATAAILILLGTASTYYSVFVGLLLAAAGLVALARTGDWRRFIGAVVAGVVLLATMVANMLPDLLYSLRNGNNQGALVRDDSETERYALKLTQLLLPAPDHRFEPFRRLRAWYDAAYPFVSERPALGLIAGAGFLGLLGVAALRLGARARSKQIEVSARQLWLRDTLGYLTVLTAVAFLFSTIGGFETLISFVTDSLRSWNRMSIFIALFCLGAVGLAMDQLVRAQTKRRRLSASRARLLAAGLAATLLVVGAWDQSTYRAIPQYATLQAQWEQDQEWVDSLEAALPDAAMIFQIAYQPFPEAASVNGVVYTDALKPYLHSSTLRWSAGGLRGRAQNDWGLLVAAEPPEQMVADLAAAGFEGIMVDRRTYADNGVATEIGLNSALGVTGATMISVNARYAYYSLAPEKARLQATYPQAEIDFLRTTVLQPIFIYPTDRFGVGINASREPLWTTRDPSAALILDNARGSAVSVRITMVLTSPTGATQVMLTLGEQSWVVNLSTVAASAITLELIAPPGRHELVVSPGADALNVDAATRFGVANVKIEDLSRPNLGAPAPECSSLPGGTAC